jgi:hypothetical protein
MTWGAPTKRRIPTVMIQMNFRGRGMYLLVLINFFHLPLKCYFILKTVRCFCKTNSEGVGLKKVDWVNLTQDSDKGRAVVNTVPDILVHTVRVKFLPS